MTIAALVASGPLRMGATGPAVVALQKALAARSYPLLGTGYFGTKTKESVATYQQVRGLKPTGVVDLTTAVSLDQPAPAAPAPKVDVPPWVTTAIQSIGIAEGPGNKDNPVVLAMAKVCGGQIAKTYTHDSIAWCKMFTDYCLVKNGLRGVDSLWALDNAKLGTKLKGPAVGAIASKKRTGGGHTFIVIGKDKAGNIVGVGGNQGDRVSRATFPPSVIVSYNWPSGFRCPARPASHRCPWSIAPRCRSTKPEFRRATASRNHNITGELKMKWDTVWQILRYLLIAGGGFLTGKGYLSADQVTSIIGAIGSIGAVLWGLFVKSGTTAVPDAVAARPDVPTVSAATGAVTQ